MDTNRVSNVLKSLMNAKMSGNLNFIINAAPKTLNIPQGTTIDGRIIKSSQTGAITISSDQGEIHLMTSQKLQEGQNVKISIQKNNKGFRELVLQTVGDTSSQINFKMPEDIKNDLMNITSQKQVKNNIKYQNEGLENTKPTGIFIKENPSLFTKLTELNKVANLEESAFQGLQIKLPNMRSDSEFMFEIMKLVKELSQDTSSSEYLKNLQFIHQILSTDRWNLWCLPVVYKNFVYHLKIASDKEQNNLRAEEKHKFWLELNLKNLGYMQIDGLCILNEGNKIYLQMYTQNGLSDDLKQMLSLYVASLNRSNSYSIFLKFSRLADKRDNVFQIILEEYCKEKVSGFYI